MNHDPNISKGGPQERSFLDKYGSLLLATITIVMTLITGYTNIRTQMEITALKIEQIEKRISPPDGIDTQIKEMNEKINKNSDDIKYLKLSTNANINRLTNDVDRLKDKR